MRSIHRWFYLIIVIAAIGGLSGCTIRHAYDLKCVVRDAADGKALEGVSAIVDTDGNRGDLSYGNRAPDGSDVNGRLQYRFYVAMRSSEYDAPHWYLKLAKEGYEPAVVDIKPRLKPEKDNSITPVSIVIEMRRKPNK